jgi:hypothetical protein
VRRACTNTSQINKDLKAIFRLNYLHRPPTSPRKTGECGKSNRVIAALSDRDRRNYQGGGLKKRSEARATRAVSVEARLLA